MTRLELLSLLNLREERDVRLATIIDVLLHMVASCEERQPKDSLYITGSFAQGASDAYSDLDLIIVSAGAYCLAHEFSNVANFLTTVGELVVSYPASHLDDDAHIFYLARHGWIVKLDLKITQHLPPAIANPVIALVPPSGLVTATASAPADVSAVIARYEGWLWYTYSKIARGELFSGARAIEYTRERAILPLVLEGHGLPQDGHRHLEHRLPPALLQELRATYPTSLSRDELLRAFFSSHDVFTAACCRLGHNPEFSTMLKAIDNDLRASNGDQ